MHKLSGSINLCLEIFDSSQKIETKTMTNTPAVITQL